MPTDPQYSEVVQQRRKWLGRHLAKRQSSEPLESAAATRPLPAPTPTSPRWDPNVPSHGKDMSLGSAVNRLADAADGKETQSWVPTTVTQ
jgi:hypothetical protein